MPIYEYQCQSCEHQLEVLQKISDAPLQDCPSCGETALKKLVSAVAFRLKGAGWYETDFKTGAKKNIAGDKTSSDSGSESAAKDSSSGSDKGGSSGSDKGGSSGSDKGSSSGSDKGSGKTTATA